MSGAVRPNVPCHWGIIAALVATLAGCADAPVDASDLPGIYVYSRNGFADTIVVLPDAHYRHSVMVGGQRLIMDTATWSVARVEGGDLYLRLQDFRSAGVLTIAGGRGEWPALIDRAAGGRLRLVIDDDTGEYYDKVGQGVPSS